MGEWHFDLVAGSGTKTQGQVLLMVVSPAIAEPGLICGIGVDAD
jgi:hypothetical protein